jgi:hypothetical protein
MREVAMTQSEQPIGPDYSRWTLRRLQKKLEAVKSRLDVLEREFPANEGWQARALHNAPEWKGWDNADVPEHMRETRRLEMQRREIALELSKRMRARPDAPLQPRQPDKAAQERDQLGIALALIKDASFEIMMELPSLTLLLGSAELRVHVLAVGKSLSELESIAERRLKDHGDARDASDWAELVGTVQARLQQVRELDGKFGRALARLPEYLPRRLPSSQASEDNQRPASVTKAPAPPREVGGHALASFRPKPLRMASRPDDFPGDLWPRVVVILSAAIEKFRDQNHLRELCEHVVVEMTPLYYEAVETGKMKASAVLADGSGMEELLRLLLVANDPGHSSWGISNQAWEILQGAKTVTWGKLAQAITEVQQRTANQMKCAPSAAPKTQSTGIIPDQFAGLPSLQATQRRAGAAERLRTEEKQTAQSPDPVLDAFNRRDTTVASERTSVQNNRETTQTVEDQPTGDGAKARIGTDRASGETLFGQVLTGIGPSKPKIGLDLKRSISAPPDTWISRAAPKPGNRGGRTRKAADTREGFLRPILDKKGFSVHEWARKAKVDFHTADNYLKAKTQPRPDTLKNLADALGVTVKRLKKLPAK